MFEQYAQALKSEVPHLEVEGETYPPPRINEVMSNVLFVVRMCCIALLFGGPQLLEYLGIQNPPAFFTWAQENKVCHITLSCDLSHLPLCYIVNCVSADISGW